MTLQKVSDLCASAFADHALSFYTVAVFPHHFHFVIIPLTADCGIFRSEEILQLDLLHRWHRISQYHAGIH